MFEIEMLTCFCEEGKQSLQVIYLSVYLSIDTYLYTHIYLNLEVAKGSYENVEKREKYPAENLNFKKAGIRKPQTFQKFYMTPNSFSYFYFDQPICYFEVLIFFFGGNAVDILSFI